MDSNNVILIGLDGLDWLEIEPWIQEGDMGNIKHLSEYNQEIQLGSTHPPWTPCAWPSLLSGRNPGKHGIFDFFIQQGYTKQLGDRSNVDSAYLFEIADAYDLSTIIINFPVTFPTQNLNNSVVIPGYLATEDVQFYPTNLRKDYENEYRDYSIYPDVTTDEEAVTEYINVAQHRRDMARFLNKRYNWDFLAVQFQVTDTIFHDLTNRNQIRQVLKEIDNFVDDIIDLGGEDPTVFITSDHGMGDYDWTFYINSWLAEKGYCETTTGEEQYFRQAKDNLKEGTEEVEFSIFGFFTGIAVSTLSAVGLSPRRIHRALGKVGLDKIVERLLPEEALVAAQNQVVDHENSIAYQLLFNSLGIHLNVEGREPNGVLPQSDYEQIRSELIEELKDVRDPDGNFVFDAVKPREEVYEGKHLEDAPDISLFPRDYRYDVSGSILDTFRRYPHKNHKPNGILISNRSLGDIDQAEIYDIAPTVAAELGIPVDSNTDGKVLTDTEEEVERQDWDEIAGDYATTRSQHDTSNVEDRLADLGYME
ncbi:alkaline phosphatase family protein [Halobellus captivus]|uniref:alkaline phosphatase family protein n=1 Tax=Halobellus captivus TaxID=2592614 RepID=UPI0011A5D507|nr:alkaline phosphatase family protein [Halobellus captivus]